MAAQSPKFVRVVSGDHHSFLVPEDALRASTVAAAYIDTFGLRYADEGAPPEFPFPGVNGAELAKVLQFCKEKDRKGWALKLALTPTPQLLKLLRAADFCSVTELYDQCCEAVAHRMRGQTPGQLKAMLGLQGRLTEAQRVRLRAHNVFCPY